ncbi:MAG: hypothetical protein AB1705_01370 [Verrucomicrobiota bacterium]
MAALTEAEKGQLEQTIEMFEVITQSQPQDYQSLEILKEAYFKLGRQKDVVGTAKRIAQAYVGLGQLSSAILEYESILQQYPDDPDVQKALQDLERQTTGEATAPDMQVAEAAKPSPTAATDAPTIKMPGAPKMATDIDDGRLAMRKIFVDGKLISPKDFDVTWPAPELEDPMRVVDPFIQILADKGLLPIEQSLKALIEKSRLGYFPLEKYDVDIELARSFPREVCQRWCVLPIDRMSKSVLVATVNPFNNAAAAELAAKTQYRLLWYIAPPADLVKVLKKIFR